MAIKSICSVAFSIKFVQKIFCKLLSKYLWQSLFWIPLDWCNCIRKIVFWETSYCRHWNNTQTTKASLRRLFHIKNEGCKCRLGNKEQKAMFIVASRSDMQFGFEHPFFCVPNLYINIYIYFEASFSWSLSPVEIA